MLGGYGELAFQFGLVDENQKAFIESQCDDGISSIQKKDFFAAFKVKIKEFGCVFPSPFFLD